MRYGKAWALLVGLFFLSSLGGHQAIATSSRTATIVETKAIPYEVRYEFSRGVGAGRIKKASEGVPGSVRRTYAIVLDGEKVVSKTLVDTVRVEPVHEVFQMGPSGFQSSRHKSFRPHAIKTMNATAYDPSAGRKNPTFRTATGRRAQFGVVAVDPRVIPLNTLVFVEGYGFAIAADTGGAIKGNKIDLCFDRSDQVRQFGRRPVRVHILKPVK